MAEGNTRPSGRSRWPGQSVATVEGKSLEVRRLTVNDQALVRAASAAQMAGTDLETWVVECLLVGAARLEWLRRRSGLDHGHTAGQGNA